MSEINSCMLQLHQQMPSEQLKLEKQIAGIKPTPFGHKTLISRLALVPFHLQFCVVAACQLHYKEIELVCNLTWLHTGLDRPMKKDTYRTAEQTADVHLLGSKNNCHTQLNLC